MGLKIINIQKIIVLGDSLLVINQERKKIVKEGSTMSCNQERITWNLKQLKEVIILHVKRKTNSMENTLANEAVALDKGVFVKNRVQL